MLGPQSVLVFLLLILISAGLTWVLLRPGRLTLRLGAAVVSFGVAAVFGMACVNRYYDYYQTWGDLARDLTGRQPGVAALPAPGAGGLSTLLKSSGDRTKKGLLAEIDMRGSRSGIDQYGLVFLPPEYFRAAYAKSRFPVLELMHGAPGRPADWETGLHVTSAYRKLDAEHKIKPTILVMPNINAGMGGNGSQCLNIPGGPQVDTYLTQDVPSQVIASFRAEPVGRHWGVAGYSEGGFCAANLALRHPDVYRLAGVMSGYFQPLPESGSDPFRNDAKAWLANDPQWLAEQLPLDKPAPAFWLMAGAADRGDVAAARSFRSVLERRERTPLVLVPHARHTFAAWNPALPKLLTWATKLL